MKGQSELALVILKSLRESDQDATDELAEIQQSIASHRRHNNDEHDENNNDDNKTDAYVFLLSNEFSRNPISIEFPPHVF